MSLTKWKRNLESGCSSVWLDFGCNVSTALHYHVIKMTLIVCLPGWWKSVVVSQLSVSQVCWPPSLSLSQLPGCSRQTGPVQSQPASQPMAAATKYSNSVIKWENWVWCGDSGLRTESQVSILTIGNISVVAVVGRW